jgi:hypothetical protein
MMKHRTYLHETGRPGDTIPGILKSLVSVLLLLSIAFGCSRPIKPKSDFLTVKLGDMTFIRYFDLMEKVEFEGEQAILLSDFIDSVVTERPPVYAYRII